MNEILGIAAIIIGGLIIGLIGFIINAVMVSRRIQREGNKFDAP
jgi:hypothetical protein